MRTITIFVLLIIGLGGLGAAADGPFQNLPPFQPDATMLRSAIPAVYHWNLTPLCPSDEQWAVEISQCKKELAVLPAKHSGLGDPAGLLDYLRAYFALDDKINRLTLYANMQRDVEASDQAIIARHETALNLTEALMREGVTLRQVILGMSEANLSDAIKKAPAIADCLPYINSQRRRADHVLSPAEEKLLAMAGDNLWAQIDLNELPSPSEKAFRAIISDMTLPTITTADGEKVQLTFANFGRYRAAADRTVRQGTVAALFKFIKSYENTLATTLGEQAKFSLFLSRARGYDTVLEAYLDKDDLEPAAYMNLINTVRAHVGLLHNYVALRGKALGLDAVHLYDLYVPMAEQPELPMDFNTGAGYILDALKPLGDDYLSQLKTGLNPANGWIDLYPSNDKNSGAFSTSTYGVHPYVKMNFQNTFDDVSTLAHEFGHALHSHYAMTSQPYLSYRYVPFLAEIASTCNEVLLSQYMLGRATSDKEKAWLLSELLETIRTTIFRQTMFAEFELKLHQLVEAGLPVNAATINTIYSDLLRAYYGPDYVIDENDAIEWAYIPHFYYKYYVFTYATGLSSGIAFAQKLQKGDEKAREAYLSMLKGGCAKPPLVLLQEAGLDLTKPAAIEAAMALFDKTLKELQEIIVE